MKFPWTWVNPGRRLLKPSLERSEAFLKGADHRLCTRLTSLADEPAHGTSDQPTHGTQLGPHAYLETEVSGTDRDLLFSNVLDLTKELSPNDRVFGGVVHLQQGRLLVVKVGDRALSARGKFTSRQGEKEEER